LEDWTSPTADQRSTDDRSGQGKPVAPHGDPRSRHLYEDYLDTRQQEARHPASQASSGPMSRSSRRITFNGWSTVLAGAYSTGYRQR
ncbi:MAG TPA: hypothetical protein VHN80_08215, partial [Kineosporiaceae bacterium]|nr:hypothetical protein [Kineosporiaceae bacterium]